MIILTEDYVSTELNVNAEPYTTIESVARALREAITAENGATNMYEKMVDAFKISDLDIPEEVLKITQSVADEEKIHVGEFQKCLDLLSTNDLDFYEKGKKEEV